MTALVVASYAAAKPGCFAALSMTRGGERRDRARILRFAQDDPAHNLGEKRAELHFGPTAAANRPVTDHESDNHYLVDTLLVLSNSLAP